LIAEEFSQGFHGRKITRFSALTRVTFHGLIVDFELHFTRTWV
jgi:hypothetical protein